MSVKLDQALQQTGTRFRIFPQPRFLPGFTTPETIYVSVPVGQVRAGPQDDRMYVVDAAFKLPYGEGELPPYTGASNPPVQPGADGHFDKLGVTTRAFQVATMYATVRRVLDIWEDYFGGHIPWHFEARFARMELIPLIEWDNAQSGYGFLEFGYGRTPTGGIDHTRPYCENFDVLAHETGHSIIFSKVGVPGPGAATVYYGGMHEASGDLVAIVSTLHSDMVVDHLLGKSCGNLFSNNELERVGDLSESRQIRSAFNSLRMSDVTTEAHSLSQPLCGGVFDVMVEVFQKKLVAGGLIAQALADASTQDGKTAPPDPKKMQADFAKAYKGKEAAFKACLLEARDYLGRLLAIMWSQLSPNHLTYDVIVRGLLAADRTLTNGEHQETIRSCFVWREIVVTLGSPLMARRRMEDCGVGR